MKRYRTATVTQV